MIARVFKRTVRHVSSSPMWCWHANDGSPTLFLMWHVPQNAASGNLSDRFAPVCSLGPLQLKLQNYMTRYMTILSPVDQVTFLLSLAFSECVARSWRFGSNRYRKCQDGQSLDLCSHNSLNILFAKWTKTANSNLRNPEKCKSELGHSSWSSKTAPAQQILAKSRR